MAPLFAAGDHTVDGTPVGEAADIAVVDEDVGLELAGEVGIGVGGFFWVVAVGGVELDAAFAAPVEGCIEELALATGPEDEAVVVGDEHLEGVDGEGALGTDIGVAVFDDRAVKVDCNYHERIYNLTIYNLQFIFRNELE